MVRMKHEAKIIHKSAEQEEINALKFFSKYSQKLVTVAHHYLYMIPITMSIYTSAWE